MNLDFFSGLGTPIVMGILLGGLYSLIALGLSLVFGVMKLINVAHGDLVILSAYIAYALLSAFGIDPILSLVIGIPVLFGLGYLIQTFLLNRAFKISMEAPLIIAFGISIVFQNIFQIVWSPMSRGLTTSYALKSFSLGNIHVPLVYLLDFIAAIIVLVLLREFLRRTYLGKAINAASQDRGAAHLMGINTNRVYALAFSIAMAVAAVGGVFLGLTFPFTPASGPSFLIIAFGVIVLGGMGNMLGTFIGGIIMGLAQTLGGYFLNATSQLLVAYVIVLIVLSVRPQGIFGR
jgi:branched-chain amino acid transport system permease protein